MSEWTPTPENINALPAPVRQYIHDLETRCDPAGDVRTIAMLQENVQALIHLLEERGKTALSVGKPEENLYVWGTDAATERVQKALVERDLFYQTLQTIRSTILVCAECVRKGGAHPFSVAKSLTSLNSS